MNIRRVQELIKTPWLTFKKAFCENDQGKTFEWDFLSRNNDKKIVVVVARNAQGDILVNKQFRAPLGTYLIEFPKGIIDEGETTEQAAIRELKEETGYEGEVISVSEPVATCGYLTSELAHIVEIYVDGSQIHPKILEDTEEIENFWLNTQNFGKNRGAILKDVDNKKFHQVKSLADHCLISALIQIYLQRNLQVS